MSRIGKHPVELAQGVSATLADGFISVKGPKGEVRMHVLPKVAIEQDGNVLSFKQLEETRESNANVGTMRALVADMNKGVSVGFEKKLTLVGVGYRAQAQGDKLNLQLGFSHPVVHQMPAGVPAKRPPRRKSSSRALTSRRSVRPPLSCAATALPNPTRVRASAMLTNTSSSRKPRRSKAGF